MMALNLREDNANPINDVKDLRVDYRLLTVTAKLGVGGCGNVYKARHKHWGQVAYKELFGSINPHKSSPLLKELKFLKDMHHPNIIQLLGFIWDPPNTRYGLLLYYCPHGSLEKFLKELDEPCRATSFNKMKFCLDIATGMNYLHTRTPAVIHRDLKIQNVLVDDGCRMKLADFGISAWRQTQTQMTRDSTMSAQRGPTGGTCTHMAPEKWMNINFKGSQAYDVYAMAIVMWEIFTEEVPFGANDLPVICEAVKAGQRPDVDDLKESIEEVEDEQTREVLVQLVEDCWKQVPTERPTFQVVMDILNAKCTTHAAVIERHHKNLLRSLYQYKEESPRDVHPTDSGVGTSVAAAQRVERHDPVAPSPQPEQVSLRDYQNIQGRSPLPSHEYEQQQNPEQRVGQLHYPIDERNRMQPTSGNQAMNQIHGRSSGTSHEDNRMDTHLARNSPNSPEGHFPRQREYSDGIRRLLPSSERNPLSAFSPPTPAVPNDMAIQGGGFKLNSLQIPFGSSSTLQTCGEHGSSSATSFSQTSESVSSETVYKEGVEDEGVETPLKRPVGFSGDNSMETEQTSSETEYKYEHRVEDEGEETPLKQVIGFSGESRMETEQQHSDSEETPLKCVVQSEVKEVNINPQQQQTQQHNNDTNNYNPNNYNNSGVPPLPQQQGAQSLPQGVSLGAYSIARCTPFNIKTNPHFPTPVSDDNDAPPATQQERCGRNDDNKNVSSGSGTGFGSQETKSSASDSGSVSMEISGEDLDLRDGSRDPVLSGPIQSNPDFSQKSPQQCDDRGDLQRLAHSTSTPAMASSQNGRPSMFSQDSTPSPSQDSPIGGSTSSLEMDAGPSSLGSHQLSVNQHQQQQQPASSSYGNVVNINMAGITARGNSYQTPPQARQGATRTTHAGNPRGNPRGNLGENIRVNGGRVHITGNDGDTGETVHFNRPPVQIGNNNCMNIRFTGISPHQRQQLTSMPGVHARVPRPAKTKVYITDSPAVIDEVNMQTMSIAIGRRWKEVGRKLGLEEGVLEALNHDHHQAGLKEIIYQMLRQWKETFAALATLKELADKLIELKMYKVAAQLQAPPRI